MWPLPAQVAFLLVAGVLAGIASSSGAIGSLIAFPALLAVGLTPVTANVTTSVAFVAVGVGATIRSGPELAGTRGRLPGWAALSVLGAAVGAALLLTTPSRVFAWVVPFLVATAALVLLFQPRIAARRGAHRGLFAPGLVATTAYEGYFGAGAGVLTLALTLVSVESALPRANALKNMLLGVADLVAAVVFVIAGAVSWRSAIPLGIGLLGGGMLGPSIVRRIRPAVLRAVVAVTGFVLAVFLLVAAARS